MKINNFFRQGKNKFVVLSIEEYRALSEIVEDYQDLQDLREEKSKSQGMKSVPLESVINELNIGNP